MSAIRRMKARDPFVPVNRESAPASTPSSAPTHARALVCSDARAAAAPTVAPGRFDAHQSGRRRARSRDAG